MIPTDRVRTVAAEIAEATTDAYSFRRYGARQWASCCALLLARGYNRVEAECIMRSRFTRYATDRVMGRRRATADDLADLLDHRSGGPAQLRAYVDACVIATMQPEPVKLASRAALRLVASRVGSQAAS